MIINIFIGPTYEYCDLYYAVIVEPKFVYLKLSFIMDVLNEAPYLIAQKCASPRSRMSIHPIASRYRIPNDQFY